MSILHYITEGYGIKCAGKVTMNLFIYYIIFKYTEGNTDPGYMSLVNEI
jgi:hypothetical protein